jgi:hypothetical protein
MDSIDLDSMSEAQLGRLHAGYRSLQRCLTTSFER